jgi:molecular chaperone GrpE
MQEAGIAATVETLIPVFDSMEASAHEVVLKQLDTALQKLGVERYRPAEGDQFDPNMHEPVSAVATSDASLDNTIQTALQSGYKRGETLLRPARVTVFHLS